MLNEESRVALTNYAIEKLGEAIARRAEAYCDVRSRVYNHELTFSDHKEAVDLAVMNITRRLGV